MFRWGVVAYTLMTVAAVCIAGLWLERSLLQHPDPWLQLDPTVAALYSLLLGVTFAAAVVLGSRLSVRRFAWARRLHEAFRPFATHLSGTTIVALALASGVGEEALFRGLLDPALGLLPQAVLFGLVHQLPGPSRWVWIAWAGIVGLGLGVIFELTGSLLGPIVAHTLINGLNLNYLRLAEHKAQSRGLGGLLDRPSP
jgi:uncharacterized protein